MNFGINTVVLLLLAISFANSSPLEFYGSYHIIMQTLNCIKERREREVKNGDAREASKRVGIHEISYHLRCTGKEAYTTHRNE